MKRSKKKIHNESATAFVNHLVNDRPESAKKVLSALVNKKIKQRIINNINTKLF